MGKVTAKTKSKKTEEKKVHAGKDSFFKTRKTREPEADAGDTLTPPEQIAQAIDAFREAQEQAKHFEGEATFKKTWFWNIPSANTPSGF